MTRTRKARATNSFDPDDQSLESIAETGALPDPSFEDVLHDEDGDEDGEARSEPQYTSDRLALDVSRQTLSEALDPETPNTADTKLQASGAYQVLRQPDEEDRTSVGTI